MIQKLVLVFVGGGLGAVLRWQLSSLVVHRTADWRYPLATFIVNVIGCLVAGVVAGLIVKRDLLATEAQLFLLTGVLGGFTTFSAFGVDCVHLLRRQEYSVAVAYILSSVVCGILGLWLALTLVPRGR